MNKDIEIRFCCKTEDGWLWAFVAGKWRRLREWNKAWGPYPVSRKIQDRIISSLAINSWGHKLAGELRSRFPIVLEFNERPNEQDEWPWDPRAVCTNILVPCECCGNPLGHGREVKIHSKDYTVWHPKCWADTRM